MTLSLAYWALWLAIALCIAGVLHLLACRLGDDDAPPRRLTWDDEGWDDDRDGPLPRTDEEAGRYYDRLIERGEW